MQSSFWSERSVIRRNGTYRTISSFYPWLCRGDPSCDRPFVELALGLAGAFLAIIKALWGSVELDRHAAAFDRAVLKRFDDGRGNRLFYFYERKGFGDFDGSDLAACDARFVGDGSDNVAGTHAGFVTGADEDAAHAGLGGLGQATGSGSFALGAVKERRLGNFFLVAGTVDGTVGKRDGCAGDIHWIELRAQRFDDHAVAFNLLGVGKLFGNGILQCRQTLGTRIGKRGNRAHFNLGLGVRFQKAQAAMFARLDDGDGSTAAAGTSRTADTVYVGFRRGG